MPLSVPRCAKARFLFTIVLVALSRDVGAQQDARDALIEELRQRIEELEKKSTEHPAPPPPPAAAPPPPPAGATRPPAAAPKPSASEEAGVADEGARALERALVREGGLVLPRAVTEVEPRLEYTYRGIQGLNLVTINGVAQVAHQDVRINELEASIAVRRGLRGSLQIEARLPYVWMDQNRAIASVVSESERVSGWGDVELSLTKQLATHRRGGLLGSLVWRQAASTSPAACRPAADFISFKPG